MGERDEAGKGGLDLRSREAGGEEEEEDRGGHPERKSGGGWGAGVDQVDAVMTRVGGASRGPGGFGKIWADRRPRKRGEGGGYQSREPATTRAAVTMEKGRRKSTQARRRGMTTRRRTKPGKRTSPSRENWAPGGGEGDEKGGKGGGGMRSTEGRERRREGRRDMVLPGQPKILYVS
jgi:hypothetical protein